MALPRLLPVVGSGWCLVHVPMKCRTCFLGPRAQNGTSSWNALAVFLLFGAPVFTARVTLRVRLSFQAFAIVQLYFRFDIYDVYCG